MKWKRKFKVILSRDWYPMVLGALVVLVAVIVPFTGNPLLAKLGEVRSSLFPVRD